VAAPYGAVAAVARMLPTAAVVVVGAGGNFRIPESQRPGRTGPGEDI
jgi:hypothetical protein